MRVVDASQPVFPAIPVSHCPQLWLISTNCLSSDDVTVEVIFFGEGPDNRTISINEEASAAEEAAKPKL